MQVVQRRNRLYPLILIVALCVAGCISSARAQVDAEIPFVSEPGPTIDGEIDDVWSLCAVRFTTITLEGSAPTSPADCTAGWQALCTPQFLYVLIDVQDESLIQDSSSGWDDDRVELFIDGDNSKDATTNATATNDYQFNFRWNNATVETPVEYYTGTLTGVQYAIIATVTGYRLEIKLPWSTLTGAAAQLGQFIGIDVLVDDDDDGGGRDTQISWHTPSSPPHDPTKWGTAEFVHVETESASNPRPEERETDVWRDVVLGWTPGKSAVAHDVYFGDSFDDVNDASATAPAGALRSQGQEPNSFDPGRLQLGQTYYWRIDEVTADAVVKGRVWSFTVEVASYPLPGSRISASASHSSVPSMGPERTIDGSGLDAYDQHSTKPEDMWFCAAGTAQWIQYAFDRAYVLDQMIVWNSNQSLESILGLGAKDVSIQYSMDGENWNELGNFTFNQANGLPTYTANTTIDFQGAAARYVKLTITSNWGGVFPQYSLSEVRFFYVPMAAWEPVPADGATDVPPQVTLSWIPGRQAASHEVHLSDDREVVTTSQPSYAVTLDLHRSYYWSVVEVNLAEDPATWESDVWSFTTSDSVVVEDFERYGNDSPNRVFQTWHDGIGFSPDEFFPDGYGGNGTGAILGYDPQVRNIMETAIVHGGTRSVAFAYENTASVPTSEITRTFDAAQDWTLSAIETLSVCFYGDPNNPGNAPLWVKLTDQNNNSAKTTFGAAVGETTTAITQPAWTEWNMSLARFTGVDMARITAITIGIGPGTGTGQLLLDDIRLYPAQTP